MLYLQFAAKLQDGGGGCGVICDIDCTVESIGTTQRIGQFLVASMHGVAYMLDRDWVWSI